LSISRAKRLYLVLSEMTTLCGVLSFPHVIVPDAKSFRLGCDFVLQPGHVNVNRVSSPVMSAPRGHERIDRRPTTVEY